MSADKLTRCRVAWLLIGTLLIGATAVTFGRSSGAAAGFSGGPAGLAQNCTACHPFNPGTGRVEMLGAPARYRSGVTYDLTVRVTAPEEDGAGFEISAEGAAGHQGFLSISDALHTKFAGTTSDYVTHTIDGLDDSLATWIANGGSYDYSVRWEAPAADAGAITFFTSALGVTPQGFTSVRYYATHATTHYAEPGDGDGDTDVDLRDFAALQRCFGAAPPASNGCEFVDLDGDGSVALPDVASFAATLTGPTSDQPARFVLADKVRGGRLYDKWWVIGGAAEPVGEHPLYPEAGQQTGSSTYRCAECHGWDYKGLDGAYGAGSHFTGITGVQHTALTPEQLFAMLKSDDYESGGHNLDAFGMSDADLWDVVRMTLDGVIETDDFVDAGGAFIGDEFNGQDIFGGVCAACHGQNGDELNFGDGANPVYVGTIASDDPWKFLHKVRFAHPGSPMPAFELLGWPTQFAADTGTHAATLP